MSIFNEIFNSGFRQATHELSVSSQLREDLESRFGQLHKRLTSLRAESEEVWKTLETAESTLMDMISAKDYDVTPLFTAAAAAAAADDDKSVALLAASLTAAMGKQQPEAAALKLRADRQETEDFYLTVSPIHSSTPSIDRNFVLHFVSR